MKKKLINLRLQILNLVYNLIYRLKLKIAICLNKKFLKDGQKELIIWIMVFIIMKSCGLIISSNYTNAFFIFILISIIF